MTTEREKLHDILRREGDLDGREYHIAQAILAAGFRLVTPTSEGEAKKAARRIAAAYDAMATMNGGGKLWDEEAVQPDDIMLCARYILSLAPGKNVVEGARAVMREITPCEYACGTSDKCECADRIAAFATAHAARKKEACAAEIDELLRSFTYESDHAHPGKLYNDGFVRAATACAAVLRARTP